MGLIQLFWWNHFDVMIVAERVQLFCSVCNRIRVNVENRKQRAFFMLHTLPKFIPISLVKHSIRTISHIFWCNQNFNKLTNTSFYFVTHLHFSSIRERWQVSLEKNNNKWEQKKGFIWSNAILNVKKILSCTHTWHCSKCQSIFLNL